MGVRRPIPAQPRVDRPLRRQSPGRIWGRHDAEAVGLIASYTTINRSFK
jgi:hypothetical protein